mmetsp:Transcript_47729/g.137473  ORF Transcript_47729/g.137473 Transcript_47729/m.137473 type:complete len:261 (+) Transcript_47729:570-1352(+)
MAARRALDRDPVPVHGLPLGLRRGRSGSPVGLRPLVPQVVRHRVAPALGHLPYLQAFRQRLQRPAAQPAADGRQRRRVRCPVAAGGRRRLGGQPPDGHRRGFRRRRAAPPHRPRNRGRRVAPRAGRRRAARPWCAAHRPPAGGAQRRLRGCCGVGRHTRSLRRPVRGRTPRERPSRELRAAGWYSREGCQLADWRALERVLWPGERLRAAAEPACHGDATSSRVAERPCRQSAHLSMMPHEPPRYVEPMLRTPRRRGGVL